MRKEGFEEIFEMVEDWGLPRRGVRDRGVEERGVDERWGVTLVDANWG